jgi:mannose-6-phosphate isomerase
MHKFEVEPGETYLIEGGVPHAIGANCFLIEIQEPTDYTIRTERITPGGFVIADEMCHQGLGFEKMFECFYYDGHTAEETLSRCKIEPLVITKCSDYDESEIIGYNVTPCFAINKVIVRTQYLLENSQHRFSGLYVLAGRGVLKNDDEVFELEPGSQFFIPASLNKSIIRAIESQLTIVRFYGPVI